MDALFHPVAALTWRDWATVVSVLFGVITLLAFLEQRRSLGQQADLIQFVRRHVSRDISEDAIRNLEKQRAAMQVQVAQHIPALARAAVLREQADAHAVAVSQHFIEWQRIQGILGTKSSGSALDPAIEAIVVDRLVPRYERQATQDRLRNRITVFSVALALVSALLPFPLSSAAAAVLGIPLAATLLQFFRTSAEPEEVRRTLRPIALVLYVVSCVAAASFAVMLFVIRFKEGDALTSSGLILTWILLVAGIAGGAMTPLFRKGLDVYLARLTSTEKPAKGRHP